MITIESFHCADRGDQNNVSERNRIFRIKSYSYVRIRVCFCMYVLGVDRHFFASKTFSRPKKKKHY